ncbi:hypothetical protein THAOC_28925, partial [Thalassiosira oceanica]
MDWTPKPGETFQYLKSLTEGSRGEMVWRTSPAPGDQDGVHGEGRLAEPPVPRERRQEQPDPAGRRQQ